MKLLFLLALSNFYGTSTLSAQVFTKKYFEGSQWASFAKDSLFFKGDTIKIVKTIKDSYFKDGKSMNVASYFGFSDYYAFEFQKHKKMKFATHKIDSWEIFKLIGIYSWDYDSKTKVLNFYFNNKVIASFETISDSEKKVAIKSNYVDHPDLETVEISLKRRL